MASSEASVIGEDDEKKKGEPKSQSLMGFFAQCAQFFEQVGELYKKQGDMFKKMSGNMAVEKPKRIRKEPWVPTGYQRFMSKRRLEFKTENPTIRGRDIMRLAAAEWNGLTDAEKAVYNEAAVSDRERLTKQGDDANDVGATELGAVELGAAELGAAELGATDLPADQIPKVELEKDDTPILPTRQDEAESEKKKKKKKRKKSTKNADDALPEDAMVPKKKKKKKSESIPSV